MSFDHRIVDGLAASRFMSDVSKGIEEWSPASLKLWGPAESPRREIRRSRWPRCGWSDEQRSERIGQLRERAAQEL